MSGKSENAMALAASLGVTAVVKQVLDKVWRASSGGKTAPTDPTDPDVQLREALLWAVLSGVAISVARTYIARRLARNERREKRVLSATR